MIHNRRSSLLRRAQAGIVPRVHDRVGGGGGVGVCARSPCNDRRSSCVFVIIRVVNLADFVGVVVFKLPPQRRPARRHLPAEFLDRTVTLRAVYSKCIVFHR